MSVDLPDDVPPGAAAVGEYEGRVERADVIAADSATLGAAMPDSQASGGWTPDAERDASSDPEHDATPDAETAVADALSVIDGLADLPPAEHVGRFEHVHDVLRAQLSGDA